MSDPVVTAALEQRCKEVCGGSAPHKNGCAWYRIEDDKVEHGAIDAELVASLKRTADNRRKHLLARMAGNIAAGVVCWPNAPEATHRERVADYSVDIAERILNRIGL